MMYVGIDPGKRGGIAAIMDDGSIMLSKFGSDACVGILEIAKQNGCKVVIEKVHSMPGQGVKSTFSFGQNFGWWHGVMDTLEIHRDLMMPKYWQKELGLQKPKGASQTEWKNILKDKAIELYPGKDITLATADAVLIAHVNKLIND